MFRKVLVAMDLSPATEALVSALPAMKEFGTEELNLVHVARPLTDPVSRSLRKVGDLKTRLNALGDRLKDEGFEVTVDVPTGAPAVEIVKAAGSREPDIILVGSRSRTRIQEAFVGSVSWEVVRQARRPVLLQRIEANRPDPEAALESRGVGLPRRVLHPTDFSEIAVRAKPWLLELAGRGSITFTLLHVLPVAANDRKAEARERLDELAAELREAGATEVKVEVRLGTPHEEVLAAGGRDSETLVVMGSNGRGFLPGMVLGSESRQIVRRASARTLLIPANMVGEG
jgi:nucleotide-binding universal stress UspA family protein